MVNNRIKYSVYVILCMVCPFAIAKEENKKTWPATVKDTVVSKTRAAGASLKETGTALKEALVISDSDLPNTEIKEVAEVARKEEANASAMKWQAFDTSAQLSGKMQIEGFGGLYTNLMNHHYDADRSWFMRHTIDQNLELHYGFDTFGTDAITMKVTLRNKSVWGNPSSIMQTTNTTFKLTDVVTGDHNHAIPRHVFWAREGSIDLALNPIFNSDSEKQHHIKLGLFPFSVGNGIALGEAFAVNPGLLGFYSDNVIDQYAPGVRIYGDAIKDKLKYDLYWAIFQSKSDSLKTTGAQVFAQQCGRRDTPERGFGHDDLTWAARLNYTAFDNTLGTLKVEPYIVYNRAPEQEVEFVADASSKLGTAGFAFDYKRGDFAFDFEVAGNFGHQHVRCWDRNALEFELRDGVPTVVNSHIVDQNGDKIVFVKGSDAQTIIDASDQSVSQNGELIGTADAVDLINADDRIRGSYTNKYKGWMFITSMGYQVTPSINLALEGGLASGDANPNVDPDDPQATVADRIYKGFIGLQEIFSGKRIKSAYVLGSRKLPRPLSLPSGEVDKTAFADSVSEFSNIVYLGGGCEFKPVNTKRQLSVRPNIIAFWEEHAGRKFDITTKTSLDTPASKYLGIEANTFVDYYLHKNLRAYAVGSVFFPGSHYKDIRGTPLSKAQAKVLSQADTTGYVEALPLLWDDTVYTVNIGLEYRY